MPNQDLLREYRKERKRVRDLIRRLKKRGYIDLDDILPPIPKKITAGSIRRLQEITPAKLYEKAQYVTPEGEIVSGRKGRILERRRATEKAKETVKKKKPQREEPKAGEKPKKEKPKEEKAPEAEVPDTYIPSEQDIIKERIREFIAEAARRHENPRGGITILDWFNTFVAEQEAKEDGGYSFYQKLKEREDDLCTEIDYALYYEPESTIFESHFANVQQILRQCASDLGSQTGDMLEDDGNDLPFN